MNPKSIPFNRPYLTGDEFGFIAEAQHGNMLAGDGPFTKRCHGWLEKHTGSTKALLTHSCTAALEIAALLLNIQPGDEIIMPSFTFVSTANAFVLRGGVPVFVDIREDTLNLDESLLEAAITSRTKAIVPVHYAGVACEMDSIMRIAAKHKLSVVEDAAQGVMAKYKGKVLGSLGDLGAYSFHETKNIISGEGGALLVNEPGLAVRAEIIREKGTDRSRFFRGEVDKYTWQEVGSSFLPGEIIAAFLWAQIEQAANITQRRVASWEYYHASLATLERQGVIRRPIVPSDCEHNAHMYYVLLSSDFDRQSVLHQLKENGVYSVFHYVPLHSSPGGLRYGRIAGGMEITDMQAERIIRLPLWVGLSHAEQDYVVGQLAKVLGRSNWRQARVM
ncbi:dTDP-4-amino-4,6-dideoxygalactose transaminase [Pollutimonas thiosulfatoxidans]|uniref:dTDP-4-amino-4,6-dideoxygalactose transaminase n=1 Tax=Pollutimonas thiosulfatoxidans TaxID=2028345 RepID=A0A410GEK9_9BURK|nr:dTDP-4-amino-4,6-dideoxygalactose transaminase [Pollutimonas thiosulfatoxidans]QAA94695.1 dTDP-4-amino-4,6-dideoxygalactose transaminase [Pollutimonas thiosulfatoxidans]